MSQLSSNLLRTTPPGSPRAHAAGASEVERLRLRVLELEERERGREQADPPTMGSLSASIGKLAESQQRLEELVLSSLGKDSDGNRAPPPGSAELATAMATMEQHGMTQEQVDNAKQIFELYDKDSSGTMDADELIEVLRFLGQNPSQESVDQMISEVDLWLVNEISLNEFLNIYAGIVTLESEGEAGAEISPTFLADDSDSPKVFIDKTTEREEVNLATIR